MRRIFLYILGAALLAPASSCNNEEFFELTYPVQSPWLNATEFEKAAIGAYYALSGNDGFRQIFPARRATGIATSDEAVFLSNAGGDRDFESIYRREGDTEIGFLGGAVFQSAYAAIGIANSALDFLESTNNDPYPFDAEKRQVPRIHGELRFVRAFAHWSLAKVFHPPYEAGGANGDRILPKRLTLPTTIQQASVSEVFSTQELYDVIVSDLMLAKDLLPERYVQGQHHPSFQDGRANKFAAAALLARVYFQMGKFDEALAELNYVIDQNGGDYNLSEDPIEAFNKDSNARGKEVIWYYMQYDGDGIGTWKAVGRFQVYNKNGRVTGNGNLENNNSTIRTLAASDAFVAAAGWMVDPRNGNYAETPAARNDKRYTQLFYRYEQPGATVGNPERRFTGLARPYVWNNRYYQAPRSQRSNTPILRLAEMYLTRAIIRHMKNDVAGATADVNAVKRRAEVNHVPYASVTAEQIHLERMKEMAFEGDRLHYLQALKLPIPPGDRQGVAAIPYNSPGLWFRLPQRELDLNQGL
jgi:starch-binding outer membrane protein, SusD/RagB family